MIKVTAIVKRLDVNKCYLILNSDAIQIASEIKTNVAEELLEAHQHKIGEVDPKNSTQEFNFEEC